MTVGSGRAAPRKSCDWMGESEPGPGFVMLSIRKREELAMVSHFLLICDFTNKSDLFTQTNQGYVL